MGCMLTCRGAVGCCFLALVKSHVRRLVLAAPRTADACFSRGRMGEVGRAGPEPVLGAAGECFEVIMFFFLGGGSFLFFFFLGGGGGLS